MHDDTTARFQNANQALAAYSRLHTTPRWECQVSSQDVKWTCLHKNRNYFVEWEATAAGRFDWSAWSEPVGKGIKRGRGSATGVNYDTADRSLAQIFAKIGQ